MTSFPAFILSRDVTVECSSSSDDDVDELSFMWRPLVVGELQRLILGYNIQSSYT